MVKLVEPPVPLDVVIEAPVVIAPVVCVPEVLVFPASVLDVVIAPLDFELDTEFEPPPPEPSPLSAQANNEAPKTKNEARRSEEILERLKRGEKIALVTDAGSPGISDPGERVIKAAIEHGFRVEPVPGPSALVAALTASGLPTEEFHFIGFLPHKPGQRRKQLEKLKQFEGTLVLYESPYRVARLLGELKEVFGERKLVLARELTKKFEEFLRGTADELLERIMRRGAKGEFVVLVSGADGDPQEPAPSLPVVKESHQQAPDRV